MTAKELQEKCMALQRECNDKQMELRKQYAIEHNPVNMGDIVTDHYHTIRVEKMSIYGHPVPFMAYYGTELTKQGIPKKRQPMPRNPAYQCDVRSINSEPYKYVEEKM